LGHCTVVLACTMSRIKLPILVILKGLPNGWINQECQGQLYQHGNVKQAVQVIAWLDTENYQTWVREVLAVHLNGWHGYLFQDQFSVHLKDDNLIVAHRAGVEVEFIPAGYTACSQVLDKGIKSP
jgi:hypothetical protein